MLRNPLHNLPENLLNTWPVLTVFIGLIPGTKKVKDRRTLTRSGNSYWGPADRGAFVTQRSSPCQSSSIAPTAAQLYTVRGVGGGGWLKETRDCKGIKILLGIHPSGHKSENLLS